MANSKRGDRFFRPCKSTQTIIVDQNISTCTTCNCVLKKRYDKSTGMVVATTKNETYIIQKPPPLPVMKKTCTRCNSRKESTVYELEPYTESRIELNEIPHSVSDFHVPAPSNSSGFEHPQKKGSKNGDNPTPKEIMNNWMPVKEIPGDPLFKPGDKYVDVTPRDFSLRKYFPELFLSETEKQEIRERELRELEDIRKRQQDEFRDTKCPKGNCNSNNPNDFKIDQYWRNVVDNLAIEVIRTPCPWRDVDMPLAREREEVTDEESRAKVKTNSKRQSKWLRWPCSTKKLGKKSENKKIG